MNKSSSVQIEQAMSDRKRLIGNFASLTVLQGANYILPLITLPYLVRVLGPEKYGLIAFAQALIQYFVMFTDYGFNLTATQEISINRDDNEKIIKIFSSVMSIKITFMLISFLILFLITALIPRFGSDRQIYFSTFGIVVGNVFFPIWLFQGMEKMKYITFLNITSKLIFTISVFFVIKHSNDYVFLPLLNSIGYLTSGFLSFWILFKYFKLKFVFPSINDIREQLNEGWHVFISTLAISLYTVSTSFVLGLFTNNIIVGYYSAAEKIIKAAQEIISPMSQTIYPYISKLVNNSKEKGLIFIRKITIFVGGITLVVSSTIFVFAKFIVIVLLGEKYFNSILILKILAFLPFIIGLSNVFGIQTMLTFNYKKEVSLINISGSITNILLSLILVPLFKQVGSAISVLVSEIIITVLMLCFLQIKGIKIIPGKLKNS